MSIVANPSQTWNIVAQGGLIANAPQRVLLVGQMGSGGSAAEGVIVENIDNEGQEDSLFGVRTPLATMCRTFKRYNKISQLDALPFVNPGVGAAQAEATITITGTATGSGNIYIAIQDETDFTFVIPITSGDLPGTIATRIETIIQGSSQILVLASHPTTDVVLLTAAYQGTDGNQLKLRTWGTVPGISLALTAFGGGAGSVSAVDWATVIGERRYQGIAIMSGYSTVLTSLSAYLSSVYNSSNQIKDGVAFTMYSSSSETTATAFANPFNNKSLVVFSDEIISTSVQKGGYLVAYNPAVVSYFAAIRALRLTPDANIAQYLVGNNISNTVGGAFRAALPYHQTPFIDLPVVVNGQGWSYADQQVLLNGQVSFFGNDITRSKIVCGDIVTTYRDANMAFKYLNAVDTISQVREFFFNNCQAEFAQCVLTDGDMVGGNNIANAGRIRSFLGSLYQNLGAQGLVQAGAQAIKFFNDNLTVQIVMASGTVNISCVVPIVSQLRVINGTIQMSFNITGG